MLLDREEVQWKALVVPRAARTCFEQLKKVQESARLVVDSCCSCSYSGVAGHDDGCAVVSDCREASLFARFECQFINRKVIHNADLPEGSYLGSTELMQRRWDGCGVGDGLEKGACYGLANRTSGPEKETNNRKVTSASASRAFWYSQGTASTWCVPRDSS